MSTLASPAEVVEFLEPEDIARARWYGFFSRWFLAPPDQKDLDRCLAAQPQSPRTLESPEPESGPEAEAESELERAWARFCAAAARDGLTRLRAAYDDVFISVGEAPVSLHACVYLTGFSNERPLADVRQWLAGQGIRGTHGGLLTEDHFGLLCEAMTWLIIGDGDPGGRAGAGRGRASRAAADAAQEHLFTRFIAPACEEFCRRLSNEADAGAYRELGRLFAAFTAVERQAFDIDR